MNGPSELTDLLGHFRNLLIFQVSNNDRNLLEVSEAEATSIAEQAQLVTPDAAPAVLQLLPGGVA